MPIRSGDDTNLGMGTISNTSAYRIKVQRDLDKLENYIQLNNSTAGNIRFLLGRKKKKQDAKEQDRQGLAIVRRCLNIPQSKHDPAVHCNWQKSEWMLTKVSCIIPSSQEMKGLGRV